MDVHRHDCQLKHIPIQYASCCAGVRTSHRHSHQEARMLTPDPEGFLLGKSLPLSPSPEEGAMSEVIVTYRQRQHFPLDRAALCVNCDQVLEFDTACPACLSTSIVPLARFLNRERSDG